jgi:hypothetical protein
LASLENTRDVFFEMLSGDTTKLTLVILLFLFSHDYIRLVVIKIGSMRYLMMD